MDPFATALDALFSAPGSVAAVYTPIGGQPRSVRTIRDQQTDDLQVGSRPVPVLTNIVLLRRSDIASPARGAALQIGDFAAVPQDAPRFTVTGEPRLDVEGLTWSCELLSVD